MKYFLDFINRPERDAKRRIPDEQFEVLMRDMTTLAKIKNELVASGCTSQSELMILSYALDYKMEHNEPVTAQTIAKITGTSPPSVSRSLRSLTEKGYIERGADEKDRRSVRIVVTPLGEEKVKNFFCKTMNVVNRAFDGFTDEELIQTIQLQRRFVNAMINILSDERRKGTEC